jgi:hypothetical protein
MFRLVRASAIVASFTLAAFFTACGGDSTTSPKVTELTTEQQVAIAMGYSAAVVTELYASLANLGTSNGTAAGKDTTACDGGGEIRSSYTATATGSASNQQNTATADFTYDHCVVQSESRQYTIGGALNSHATVVTAGSNNSVTEWTIKGSLTSNGQNCAFDVALTSSTLSGTVCGVKASSLTGTSLP